MEESPPGNTAVKVSTRIMFSSTLENTEYRYVRHSNGNVKSESRRGQMCRTCSRDSDLVIDSGSVITVTRAGDTDFYSSAWSSSTGLSFLDSNTQISVTRRQFDYCVKRGKTVWRPSDNALHIRRINTVSMQRRIVASLCWCRHTGDFPA